MPSSMWRTSAEAHPPATAAAAIEKQRGRRKRSAKGDTAAGDVVVGWKLKPGKPEPTGWSYSVIDAHTIRIFVRIVRTEYSTLGTGVREYGSTYVHTVRTAQRMG